MTTPHPNQPPRPTHPAKPHPTRPLSQTMRGAGFDALETRRPGVPMELDPPHPMAGAHWGTPEHQKDPGYVLRRSDLEALTPVFGTTVPPRGLSGRIRRRAYRIAEHRTSHWFLLLLADRVDRLEHGF